jgi:GT2 family glycosyltransferase
LIGDSLIVPPTRRSYNLLMVPLVDVLIPTYQRPAALAVTLTSLLAQRFTEFRVIISDQSDDNMTPAAGEVQAVINVLRAHANEVHLLKNLPRRGMAQQRQFLLDQTAARYALFLDDDVILESYVLGNMVQAIQEEGCGLVGSALIGLTHIDDVRPYQQQIEFWEGPVEPEQVRPDTPEWQRHPLHNAANIYHVAQQLAIDPASPRKYKIAWVGGCVLYDTEKLLSVGGFSFWKDLPDVHAGEDVLAQLRVMDRYGGCGLIPSGVYHQQLPTTIPDRPVDAPKYLNIEVKKNESETA